MKTHVISTSFVIINIKIFKFLPGQFMIYKETTPNSQVPKKTIF